MSDPIVITCALTGGIHGKEANPNLPEQPDEIVEQGIAAWRAGAAILHVHVSAMASTQLPLSTIACALGLNVRVGMEDNVPYRRGEPLESNAQLFERAVRIACELDRRPASADEARELLGLRG